MNVPVILTAEIDHTSSDRITYRLSMPRGVSEVIRRFQDKNLSVDAANLESDDEVSQIP